jgi:uncharacterized protein YoxC
MMEVVAIIIPLTFLILGVYCIYLRKKLGLDDDLEED